MLAHVLGGEEPQHRGGRRMTVPKDQKHTCADCGVKITGVPVVPLSAGGPTEAQIQKLKPTVFLCVECAEERGLSFDGVAVGRASAQTPPAI